MATHGNPTRVPGPRGTPPGFPSLRRADTKQAPRAAPWLGRWSLIDGPRGRQPSCSRRPDVSAGPRPRAPREGRLIYSARQDSGKVPAAVKPTQGPARAQPPSTQPGFAGQPCTLPATLPRKAPAPGAAGLWGALGDAIVGKMSKHQTQKLGGGQPAPPVLLQAAAPSAYRG